MMRRVVASVLVGMALSWSGLPAHAQSPPAAKATLAQSLFEEAGQLMRVGNYAEACPKLAESQRLDPAGGTMYNLALCLEQEHKLASAYVAYDEALALAIRDGHRERETNIRARQNAIRPRLSKLVVHVDVAARSLAGIDVRLDDTTLREQAWSVAVPVDTGVHVVEARADGCATFRRALTITDEGRVYEFTVPALRPVTLPPRGAEPRPASLPELRRLGGPHAQDAHDAHDPQSGHPGRRVLGFLLGGTSIALLAAGSISGVLAIDRHAQSNRLCPDGRCSAEGVEAEEAADRFAWGANFGIGAGLLTGALGAYFLFTSPAPSSSSSSSSSSSGTRRLQLALIPAPGGATLRGRFE